MRKFICLITALAVMMFSVCQVALADEPDNSADLLISENAGDAESETKGDNPDIKQDGTDEKFDNYGFSDMPNDWSEAALKKAVDNEILSGDNGLIMPSDPLTRAQMATILVRAFGAFENADLSGFSDVASGDWFYQYISKAVKMNWFSGSDGKMRPNDYITREEAFVVLARAFSLLAPSGDVLSQFTDGGDVSSWAVQYASAVVAAGYAKGSEGYLNPKSNITRAEFAVLMDNIVKLYINAAGTYTQKTEGSVLVRVSGVVFENSEIGGNLYYGPAVGAEGVTLKNTTVSGRVISASSYTRDEIKDNENKPDDKTDENNNSGNTGGGTAGGGGNGGSGNNSGNKDDNKDNNKDDNKDDNKKDNSSTTQGENTTKGDLIEGNLDNSSGGGDITTIPNRDTESEPEKDYDAERNQNQEGIEQPGGF